MWEWLCAALGKTWGKAEAEAEANFKGMVAEAFMLRNDLDDAVDQLKHAREERKIKREKKSQIPPSPAHLQPSE